MELQSRARGAEIKWLVGINEEEEEDKMTDVYISEIIPEIEDLTLRSIRQALTAYKSDFYLDDLSLTQLSYLVDRYGIDTIINRIRTRQVDFNKINKLVKNYNNY